jgi:hypothetical protein
MYPNVDHIDVSLHGVHNPYLTYEIYMSDENVTKQDMFHDVDPFWLVDYHVMKVISQLIPFNHLPIKGHDYQMVIYNGSGIPIFDWEYEQNTLSPGRLGRTD